MNPYQTLVEKYTGLPINSLMGAFGGLFGRSAAAEPKIEGTQGPTRDIYEQPGVGLFNRRTGEFLGKAPAAPALPSPGAAPGMGVTPIIRREDDQYRQLLSQYGALSKAGKQEEAEKLGMEIWQKKYEKTAMAQPGGAVSKFNPLMQSTFGYQRGQEQPTSYAGQTVGQELGGDFAIAANAVPAPWNEQGAKVSAEFSDVVPFQAAKTTGEGMPAFQTTGEKAQEFLSDPRFARFLPKK